ncbi:TerD family protein [Streptomyces sp. Li-HN-5-11]|uniref:TerD family protein n=1 Tax=Streptomyces sp. Li-HN-5-11 TaxID=3075432 RepID=UPI0028AF3367|nr:TerD family protein [Streptomyces sp. Li-HN-5-11]WNM32621.1 TerD family protein [Streptomyces sp. Li-HN-5-11]WOP38636.1 TerD family protein [Streptomyces sp. Li-HN-5-13]
MAFGFRVGVPGMSVRVSTRGVRTSVGPRAARISVGSGGTRFSSGVGPLYASSSLGGGRRRTSTSRTTRSRAVAPSAAQLERARRQAERAQQEAERDAAIAQLHELRRQTTSVHLQSFTPARPPVVPGPPQLGLAWALAEAQAHHLAGLGLFARAERAAAKRRSEEDAPAYLAAEEARLHAVHCRLTTEADQWWQALISNDEETVCGVVNYAFSDNPAAGCAVGVDGAVLSVVIRQQDIDSLPCQTPGVTPGGRPTLKSLSKRERTLWWLTSMGSNVVATLREAFAVAPGISAIDLAVLTRLPDTQRLGFVAYGRWTRQAVEAGPWREANDALRFLDIGQDVACSVTTTASGNLSSNIKPLDTSRLPGLQSLLDHAQDDSGSGDATLAGLDGDLRANIPDTHSAPPPDPYRIRSVAEWKSQTTPLTPPPDPAAPTRTPAPPSHAPTTALTPGQNLVLPEEAWQGLLIAFRFAGADADLTLFLTDAGGKVTCDEDFVFYNQPSAAQGAARLLGKQIDGPNTVERAALHLTALPAHIQRVTIAVNMDVGTGLTCGSLTHAALYMDCVTGAAWTFQPPADPGIRAMAIAELYKHSTNGRLVWKLRAIGQGWAGGLDALARAHGVNVE